MQAEFSCPQLFCSQKNDLKQKAGYRDVSTTRNTAKKNE